MGVKPMAGTARMVPATRPLTRSCATSVTRSEKLHRLEGALLGHVEADLAVDDVAGLGEVAGPAGALVVDLLALGQELEPFDGVVHLHAAALRDLPHVVLDGGAGGLALRLGDGEDDQARVVVALAGVGIEVGGAEELGEPLVAGRVPPRR